MEVSVTSPNIAGLGEEAATVQLVAAEKRAKEKQEKQLQKAKDAGYGHYAVVLETSGALGAGAQSLVTKLADTAKDQGREGKLLTMSPAFTTRSAKQAIMQILAVQFQNAAWRMKKTCYEGARRGCHNKKSTGLDEAKLMKTREAYRGKLETHFSKMNRYVPGRELEDRMEWRVYGLNVLKRGEGEVVERQPTASGVKQQEKESPSAPLPKGEQQGPEEEEGWIKVSHGRKAKESAKEGEVGKSKATSKAGDNATSKGSGKEKAEAAGGKTVSRGGASSSHQ